MTMGRVNGSYGFAAMLLVLLHTSQGEEASKAAEASLLQVSQNPTFQSQPQSVSQVATQVSQLAPQGPRAQLIQSSVTAHQPVPVPVAMVTPSAGSVPLSIAPVQTALTATLTETASGVKHAQTVQMNETALAFSQLSALDTEFKELHADDASHVRQLKYNVQLREQLQEKLRQARDQLAQDNEHLAERTMEIIAGGEAALQAHSDDSQPEVDSNGANETFAALLLEAAVTSRRNREVNNAQIAAQAEARVKSLVEDIAALRTKDEEELQALRANADNRNALRKKIEERSDQLHQDTDLLVQDLGSIRNIVSKDDTKDTGSTPDAAVNQKPEAGQNEAAPQ